MHSSCAQHHRCLHTAALMHLPSHTTENGDTVACCCCAAGAAQAWWWHPAPSDAPQHASLTCRCSAGVPMRMLISLLRAAWLCASAMAMARVRAITPVSGSALRAAGRVQMRLQQARKTRVQACTQAGRCAAPPPARPAPQSTYVWRMPRGGHSDSARAAQRRSRCSAVAGCS